MLGVRTFGAYEKRNPVLSVMSSILGGGMSSRLFTKLREDLGAAYYVHSSNNNFTDHGFFEIAAGVSNDKVGIVISEILKECARLCDTLVSSEELEKTKEYLVGNMKLELESSDAWANYYGGQEVLRKKILSSEEIEKKIRTVSAKDIQKIAKEIFVDKNLNLALIGPFESEKEFSSKLTF